MSMKIIIVVLLCCLLLVGCGTSDIGLGRAGASTENEFLIRSVGERWDELLDGDNFIAEWIEDLPRGIPLKENRITLQRALEIANNIFVLNENNADKIQEFLKQPYSSVNEDVLEKYMLSDWLKRIAEIKI